MNLKDYVKIYDFLDKKTCNKIIKQIKKGEWKTHTFYNSAENSYTSYDNELSVSYSQTKEVMELHNNIWHIINKYTNEDMSFAKEWYTGWNGYTFLRFNRYDVDTQMKLHCDHIHSIFDGAHKGIPVLSILGSLNDDYEGGELVFWESEAIQLKAGQIMVFPSNFLYPHKVNMVTKGTRYSYVSWAW